MQVQRETERAHSSDPRAQGDIIRIEHVGDADAPTLGIVINADCDLAHGRLDGVITYLPVFPFRDYLARFWAPTHFTEVSNAATQKILCLIGDGIGEAQGLHDWIGRDGPDVVVSALTNVDGLKRGGGVQLQREVSRLAIALHAEDALAIVPPKTRNRFEVRHQPPRQPHQLNIAPRFTLQAAARLHAVQIAIEINLQHH